MKKNLLKTALFISIVIGMTYMSCKPDSFTEQDAMLLQSKLEKEKILYQDSLSKVNSMLKDSLNKIYEQVTYTLSVIDAAKSTALKGDGGSGDTKGGLTGVSVTLTQGGTVTTKTTAATGVVIFTGLQKGLATLHLVLTGYSEINAVIDFSHFGIGTSVTGGLQLGNVLPMIPLSGTSTGTIKGTVVCESDLTNKAPEPAPTGTKVIATVSDTSSALIGIAKGIVVSINYDGLSLEAVTDATGAFTMTVPGTSMGLNYSLRVSDFTVNQSLLMLTKGGLPVTGVQTVPTFFGTTFSSGSSTIPVVGSVIVTIGAPDYTYTPATATAVVTNVYGLNYIQMTSAGNYYYPGYTFMNIPIDNPVPGTGGTSAAISFTTNSYGQITSTTMSATGSLYATSVEGTTFTMPYIRSAAKAVVQSVNGTGGILTWKISTIGQFFSTSNIDFFRSSGTGTGATLTFLPLVSLLTSGWYFSNTSTQTPSSPLGAGYAVGDEFTLGVKSGMSDAMTGIIHMTTGSVTAINVITDGTNYISGSANIAVAIASPGLSGTTATATATVVNGKIASINIPTGGGGSGYTSAPAVTIVNKVEKVQALATATVNANGNITGFTVTASGNGYLTVPTVTLTPQITGMGSGASAVAVLSGATVGSLSLIYGGTGYTGVNTPATVQNAPSATAVIVKGSGTTITYINLGTGKRSIDN